MKSIKLVAALAAVAAPIAQAQWVPAPKDLITKQGYAGIQVRYKQVPNGICETHAHVKSYSGYADVAPNNHIHFWFFEAREVDPATAPLVTYVGGGPGASSMLGVFQEIGPCRVNSSGDVYDNPYAWNTKSNLLFIDEPKSVAMSYTKPVKGWYNRTAREVYPIKGDECPPEHEGHCGTFSIPAVSNVPNTTLGAAPAFWKTLQGFLGAFPQYACDDFHLCTESYGGHYGPVFAQYIQDQNGNLPAKARKINLKGVLIGDGWFDPATHYISHYNYSVLGNSYDWNPFNASVKKHMYDSLYGKGGCLDGLKKCEETGDDQICKDIDEFCADNVEYYGITDRDTDDIRYLDPMPFPYAFFVDYLNRPEVLHAIGAYTNYTSSSAAIRVSFNNTGDDGRRAGTIEDTRKLVKAGVYFVSYAGDADYICNWIGNEAVAKLVNAPGFSEAGYANISTTDHIVNGQVWQANNFAWARLYFSGHQSPFYQPLLALTILNRVLEGVDIETGTKQIGSHYRTVGPQKSTFREGNSTIQNKVVPENATYNVLTHRPNPY